MSLSLEPELLDIIDSQTFQDFKDKLKTKEIIKECSDQFKEQYPDVPFDSSSPLYEMACIFAYREMLLRSRINDVCKRLIGKLKEIQEQKRKPFGLKQYYIDEALNFPSVQVSDDPLVKVGVREATVAEGDNGLITISLLADNDDGNAPDKLVEGFNEHINKDEVKVWNDTIKVAKINAIGVELEAQAKPFAGTEIKPDLIKKSFIASWEKSNRLGRSRSRSWIASKLHSENVDEIVVKKISIVRDGKSEELGPNDNIVINSDEWAYLIKDKIKVTH